MLNESDTPQYGLLARVSRAWGNLGKGPKRASIAGYALLSLLFFIILTNGTRKNEDLAVGLFLGTLFGYWVLFFVGLWIYRGFKSKE